MKLLRHVNHLLRKIVVAGVLLIIASTASAQACYQSSILTPTPFMGNNGEIFKLADSSLWKVQYSYEYLYEYYPNVIICPSQGKLTIKGKTIDVVDLRNQCYESSILAPTPFMGNNGEIFKLADGSFWKVQYSYEYLYEYYPNVIICPSQGKLAIKGKSIDVVNIGAATTFTTTTTTKAATTTTKATTTTTAVATTTTAAVATTTTTAVATTTTTTLPPITLNFVPGFSLVGNGSGGGITVADTFGDANKITTVWKWLASAEKWAFYAPSLVGQALIDFAGSKGFEVLSTINAGEGFWVNAKTAFSAQLPKGAPVSSPSFQNLAPGFNLIATGDNKTPSQFNVALSTTPPASGVIPFNITTLWAWDATLGNWYFYAPSLEAKGGTALTDYISSKNYLDFTTAKRTLGPGVGFWINKP